MILANGEGRLKYVNGRFKELFGYDLDEVPDGRTWFRKVFPGLEYTDEVASVLNPAGQADGWRKRERHTLTAVCKDGTRKIFDFGAVHLTSGDIVISCADAVEGVADQNEALYAADYDALTRLPNRSSMERAVGNAIERAREGKKRGGLSAFLLLDVCNLDSINKAYGASSGDEVLVALARLLKGVLRLGDIAYRFERNRLVVVFMGISAAEARLAAGRIQRTVSQFPFTVGSQTLPIDTAVGLAQIDGSDGAIALISHATDAVDQAKASGKNQMVVHESLG
jgi:diguanylate cyclase (GGDEF)-like protein